MMYVKSSSTGKSKTKQTQSIRMTQYSTCPRLMQNNVQKKDCERSQPIRVAQLLMEEETLKKVQKDSVRKRAQPEKLGPLSNTKNSRVNNQSGEINMYNQFVCSEKHVRRNLNFNQIQSAVLENNENRNKLNKFTNDEPISKEVLAKMNRKSLLLPPNTIKHKHLQKFIKEGSKHSKVSKVSTGNILTDKRSDIYFTVQEENQNLEVNKSLLLNTELPVKNNNSVQLVSLKTSNGCEISNIFDHSNLNVINKDQLYTQDNLICDIWTPNKINSKNEVSIKPQDQDECIKNLCNNLPDTNQMVSKIDNNVSHTSSEIICVDRNKLIDLEHELISLLSTTEKNISKIKSTLTCVKKLLSVNNEEVIKSNIYIEQDYSELGKAHNVMLDKEVQVKICCKSVDKSDKNLEATVLHVLQSNVNDVKQITRGSSNQNNDINKENHETMTEKRMSNCSDESFLNLENQFNITNGKFTQEQCIQQKTPMITKYKQQRSHREYTTLKSSMNFLETPDGKRFRSLCQQSNIDTSILSRAYISNKVLADIQNLYSDSP
ncbi:uncharacterized protein LOC143146038 [Ptiloglossa arizonensis]|uniref:uncharacterized protein LOC143146038 n=1 Tax=Ptiloglossa arizonensis TaxID=3350558 RepID=UPI003FA08856